MGSLKKHAQQRSMLLSEVAQPLEHEHVGAIELTGSEHVAGKI